MLFLPLTYLITLIISGIAIGILTNVSTRDLQAGSLLFLVYAVAQLIFRILVNSTPERLVGQTLYFFLFIAVVAIAKRFRQ